MLLAVFTVRDYIEEDFAVGSHLQIGRQGQLVLSLAVDIPFSIDDLRLRGRNVCSWYGSRLLVANGYRDIDFGGDGLAEPIQRLNLIGIRSAGLEASLAADDQVQLLVLNCRKLLTALLSHFGEAFLGHLNLVASVRCLLLPLLFNRTLFGEQPRMLGLPVVDGPEQHGSDCHSAHSQQHARSQGQGDKGGKRRWSRPGSCSRSDGSSGRRRGLESDGGTVQPGSGGQQHLLTFRPLQRALAVWT